MLGTLDREEWNSFSDGGQGLDRAVAPVMQVCKGTNSIIIDSKNSAPHWSFSTTCGNKRSCF